MNGTGIPALLLLIAVIWYWQKGMQAKELARSAGRQACADAGVVFLDDSVVLSRLMIRRNAEGRLSVLREYRFEFASDGIRRYRGRIDFSGRQLMHVVMEAHNKIE